MTYISVQRALCQDLEALDAPNERLEVFKGIRDLVERFKRVRIIRQIFEGIKLCLEIIKNTKLLLCEVHQYGEVWVFSTAVSTIQSRGCACWVATDQPECGGEKGCFKYLHSGAS